MAKKGELYSSTLINHSSDNDFYSAEEEVEDNLKIFDEHLPEEMNIVLLGGTGIGKTTFINSIANMLSHPTLEIAKKNLHVLIQTSFHHIGQDVNSRYLTNSWEFLELSTKNRDATYN